MPESKVSVIVPVYNVESLLNRCIDSILCQTIPDIQLIIVDDGSTDRSGAICDRYASLDPRVTVIHKPNGGLSDARNAGLDIATGQYVTFIDADDFIHPQMMEYLSGCLRMADADIAQCEMRWYYSEDGAEHTLYPPLEVSHYRTMERKDFIDNFFPTNGRIASCTVCNKLYKREIFQDIRFPYGQYYEDSHIHLSTFDLCRRIVLLPYELYYYYQRPGSITRSGYAPKWNHASVIAWDTIQFFREKGLEQQVYHAQVLYLVRYFRNLFATYTLFRQYRKDLRPIRKQCLSSLPVFLSNPLLCKLQKAILVLSFVSPSTAAKLSRKYYPEWLYEFMRNANQAEECHQ